MYLDQYRHNVYSQYGEDGILEKLLPMLGICGGVCVDIGAWDGYRYSNIMALVKRGFCGVFVEPNASRFRDLVSNCNIPELRMCTQCTNAEATPKFMRNLAAQLTQSVAQPAVLNIDTDGNDAALWRAAGRGFPVAVIEWCDHGTDKSGSVLGVAKKMRYKLVAKTNSNMIFVRDDLADKVPV